MMTRFPGTGVEAGPSNLRKRVDEWIMCERYHHIPSELPPASREWKKTRQLNSFPFVAEFEFFEQNANKVFTSKKKKEPTSFAQAARRVVFPLPASPTYTSDFTSVVAVGNTYWRMTLI